MGDPTRSTPPTFASISVRTRHTLFGMSIRQLQQRSNEAISSNTRTDTLPPRLIPIESISDRLCSFDRDVTSLVQQSPLLSMLHKAPFYSKRDCGVKLRHNVTRLPTVGTPSAEIAIGPMGRGPISKQIAHLIAIYFCHSRPWATTRVYIRRRLQQGVCPPEPPTNGSTPIGY